MASRPFWSLHTHSQYSVNDALSPVAQLVSVADRMNYPALGLTDHGSPAGNLQLYKACRKAGMEPLPGVELYVTPDRESRVQGHNLHLTVAAYSEKGYSNLVRLVSQTARNHHYKPRVDMADLAAMAEENATQGLVVATGCWFGLVPTVLREQGPAAAEHVVKTLAGWFPRVYVELQAHGITAEEQTGDAAWVVGDPFSESGEEAVHLGEQEMIDALIDIATHTGVPYLITTDAHYAEPRDQELHNGLKKLCSWSDAPDDAIFPGGPYSLMDEGDLKSYFEPHVIETACESLADLADVASVRIPAIDSFKMLVPNVAKTNDPMAELKMLCIKGLNSRVGEESKARRDGRLQRLNHELDIIEQTGFDTYTLLLAEVCQYMDSEDIVYNARGSANNSLVNFLCRITNIDSYAWNRYAGLRFERYISVDRIKPPDVDLDIEHTKRDQVVAWCASRWTVSQIGTLARYSLFDDDEEGKGSLRVRYYATRNKAGLPKIGWKDIPPKDKAMLVELGRRRLPSGYGTHAAGLILAPDEATIADLPLTHIGSGKKAHLVTAYDKNDVEDLGFIKADFLGLRFLSAAATATRLIMADPDYEGDRTLRPIDFLMGIPLDDKAVYSRISRGQTVGTFQLGERAGIDFVTRMKPKHLNDLVAAMGLTRPAALSSGTTSDYLARRRGRDEIPVMHPDLATETKNTYGVLLFQEQVIGACRAIGMDMVELNTLLKALKASNDYVDAAKLAIEAALPRIRTLAAERGWSDADVKVLVDAVKGYGDYGFNEGHAAGYGTTAYWTAWLSEHWEPHWWTGLLDAYANEDEEPYLVRTARRYGVRILPPHINDSEVSYSLDYRNKAVRRGFLSVKGVGDVSAAELAAKRPYTSLTDLGQRVVPRRVSGAKQLALGKPLDECGGVIAALHEAGVLDGLT